MERAWTHFALVAATLLGVCAASRALPQEVLYGSDADAGTNRPALVNNGGALYLANPIGPAPAAPNACVDGGVCAYSTETDGTLNVLGDAGVAGNVGALHFTPSSTTPVPNLFLISNLMNDG